jgi:hypothetical protein
LSAALAASEQEHEKTLRHLDSAQLSNHVLTQENAGLLRDMDLIRSECHSEVEKERCERQDAVSNLAEAKKQLQAQFVEIHGMRERIVSLEREKAESAQKLLHLQEQLREALEANRSAEKRILAFEEQAVLQEALKTSRLGFVTEVWGLHSEIANIKSSIQSPAAAKASIASSCRISAKLGRAASDLENCDLRQSVMEIHRHSKHVIAKYLTDHEKLHLGAPLAHYEGGHDSPQPLDWSSISDATSTTRSTDCSFSSVDSEIAKAAKLQESQPGQQLNESRTDANMVRRQPSYQPPKCSPRRTSPSSVRA